MLPFAVVVKIHAVGRSPILVRLLLSVLLAFARLAFFAFCPRAGDR